MSVPKSLLEIKEHLGPGYQPLVDYGEWRVAILRFEDVLRAENIHNMQRHDETDEVFVLLQGECILFLGSGTEAVGEIYGIRLAPNKLYNVRKGCWHNHVLSEDAIVLVVENLDTTFDNSPRIPLSQVEMQEIRKIAADHQDKS